MSTQPHLLDDNFDNFWRCLGLCHEVMIFQFDGKKHFSGASSDELVFLEAGKTSTVMTMIDRDSEQIILELNKKGGSGL